MTTKKPKGPQASNPPKPADYPTPAPAKPKPYPLTPANVEFIIHHTASADVHTDIPDLMKERAHRGEGYQVLVDDDDEFINPAYGNDGYAEVKQDAPDNAISNGTYGHNRVAINVSVDGNFETRHPTEDEVNAVVQVIAAKAKRYGFRKMDAQTRIMGHGEAGRRTSPPYITACPGRHLAARIPEIRNRVSAYLPE